MMGEQNKHRPICDSSARRFVVTSVAMEGPPGKRKVAVKMVDIFGNDTMTIVEATR